MSWSWLLKRPPSILSLCNYPLKSTLELVLGAMRYDAMPWDAPALKMKL
jgi:hypothetical protein